jgi:polar amino acid transport system permease protein
MHDFLIIWAHIDLVFTGLINTLILIVLAGVMSILLGLILTPLLVGSNKALATMVQCYVDAMRCVPFLLFVYLIYFGLPTLGLRLSSWTAGALALVLYNTAYMAELLRGAWLELPPSILESGRSFGFTGWGLLRHIMVTPMLIRALPMIGNQLIQILKDSAFLTVIAVKELTHELNGIQSTYFIPFAAFLTALILYWIICILMEMVMGSFEQFAVLRRP